MIVPVFGAEEQIALPVSEYAVGDPTDIVIVFDVAVFELRQLPPVIVIVHATVLPLVSVLVV